MGRFYQKLWEIWGVGHSAWTMLNCTYPLETKLLDASSNSRAAVLGHDAKSTVEIKAKIKEHRLKPNLI
ncbi:hypothetical protein [Sulfitobacter sp.]|uniref:hypothetical protein n=1 Tax=Sulfitobacter sp. TaxID=1903071 RepID=UPI0035668BCA